MNANNLLPIGSVVRVQEANHKFLIIGILQASQGKKYDYIGVLYPEGFMDAKSVFLFNNEDIEEIAYLGFMGSEHQVFRNNLNNMLKEQASE